MTIQIHPSAIVDQGTHNGEQIPLPVTGQGRYTCPHTGQKYQLPNDELLKVK
jgi:UDP-2-acetamido-3-amino-2,3-dideoxy-glucuronate N-acetyltransferase